MLTCSVRALNPIGCHCNQIAQLSNTIRSGDEIGVPVNVTSLVDRMCNALGTSLAMKETVCSKYPRQAFWIRSELGWVGFGLLGGGVRE